MGSTVDKNAPPTPTDHIDDQTLVSEIKTGLVNPTYYSEIKTNLKARADWKSTGNVMDAASKVFSCFATILAFAGGAYDNQIVSFVSGCCGTVSLVLLTFSAYSMFQSKQRTDEVNTELSKLGMDNIVNIAPVDGANMSASPKAKRKAKNRSSTGSPRVIRPIIGNSVEGIMPVVNQVVVPNPKPTEVILDVVEPRLEKKTKDPSKTKPEKTVDV